MNEFPAYSWQRLCRWLEPLSRTVSRGWREDSQGDEGLHSRTSNNINGWMVWGCWLSTAWTRKIGRRSRARVAYMPLDNPAIVGIYTYIHMAACTESGIRTTRANIWSLATKNSGRANRRVDLFPYTAAFPAFFFRSISLPSPRLFRPLSPSVLPRCLHSREYSRIYLKMTPITQVKYTRALIYCLSI